MRPAKEKDARDCGPASSKTTHCNVNCSDPTPKAQAWEKIRFDFGAAIWRISYTTEEARQQHAALGHFWREAGFCILLAILRIGKLA